MKALIVFGGYQPHEPGPVAEIIEAALKAKGVAVTKSETLDSFLDAVLLRAQDVIVPIWTMGQITGDQWKGLNAAVRGGVGIAGFHGGAGDSMRGCLEFQWMIGGQFVGHPTVGEYEVYITDTQHPITAGSPGVFMYKSEQYYQIVDPGINALGETAYNYDGHRITMPCIWTKTWGKGRVFYSALGHKAQEFKDYPHVLNMTVRGILWAGKQDLA
jgi:hypothetical protein